MAVFNLGSINLDQVYRVPHLPGPGETLADQSLTTGLGGKGANQSIAIARLGGKVRHIGAVGPDGDWARAALATEGVDVAAVATVDAATGHAIIFVDSDAENMIVIHGGANRAVGLEAVDAALTAAEPGDWFLTQNETDHVAEAISLARARGLKTAHAAAPFDAGVTAGLVETLDLLAVNEGEAAALAAAMGVPVEGLPVPWLLVTYGAAGAVLRIRESARAIRAIRQPGIAVDAVDTTGAGDTFLGAFLAAVDLGGSPETAMAEAGAAAALQVTRHGAAAAIPDRATLDDFCARAPLPAQEIKRQEGVS